MKPLIDPINTDDGQFHGRDNQTGALATIVTPVYMNDTQGATRSLQQEVISVLKAAGIKPADATDNQLLSALKTLFLAEDDSRVSGALQKDKNLSDLTDIAKAKTSLSLDKVGNWPAVQANGGLHSSGNHRIYLDWAEDGKLHVTVDTSDEGELFTTTNPPNAAQTRAYPKTGGNLDEEASVTVISDTKSSNTGDTLYSPMFRVTLKGRGGDQDFKDGASGFMRIVEEVGRLAYLQLQWDGFGSIHEFRFDQQGNSQVYGKVYTGSGASFLAEDGNVYGGAWGGYLSNWVGAQIDARINNNNTWVNNQIAAQVNDAKNWVYQNFVNSSRQASATWAAERVGGRGGLQVPAGCVMIGARNNGSSNVANMGILYAAQQILVNGNWVTIGLA